MNLSLNLSGAFSQLAQKRAVADIWQERRLKAMEHLQARGWPTRKDETWKYTSTQAFKALPLQINFEKAALPATVDLLPGFHHLVFVDGVLISNLSKHIDPNIQISALNQALTAKSGPWTKWMGRWETFIDRVKVKKDFTEQVSEAFLDSGLCLQIAPNTKLDKPIQIALLSSGKADSNFSSTQVWIDVGAGANADFVLTSQGNSLQVHQTQIWAHENSKTSFLKFSELKADQSDLQRVEVQVESGAEFNSWSVGLGGRLQRNELEIYIKGAGATAKVWGVSMVAGSEVIDHHTLINHVKGGSHTEQLYKGILSDESRLVFDGQVRIEKGADKASSEQLNKNLILSGTAEVDSKPQLQVLADDVKATHGSATGQINSEEIFYFQSRGISETESRRVLALGFVEDLVDLHPLESVRNLIKTRMKTAFEKSWEKVGTLQ